MLRPLVSVLVNSWNGLAYLEVFIKSFVDHTPPGVELCIALDGCTDGSCEFVESLGAEWAWNPHQGVSGSLNAAAELASGEYYVWASNDYVFSPGWYDRLQKYLHPHNYITIDLVEPHHHASFSPGGFFGASPEEFDYDGFVEYTSGRPNLISNKIGFAFGNGAFHSDRWREVGGFDTAYDPYGVMDGDFIYSMYKNDPEMIFFCPRDVSFYHFVGGTIRDKKHITRTDLREIFENKHGIPQGSGYGIIEKDTQSKLHLFEERGIVLP